MKNTTLLVVVLLSLCIVNSPATGTVTNLGGSVNTYSSETDPFVTDNGQTMYFCKAGDIYKAIWDGTHWTNAMPVTGVNSGSEERHPWVVGNHMYFATNRWSSPPVYPMRLAMATYSGGNWGNVIQLPMPATDGIDLDPSVTADETTMYFASSRQPNYGMGDIFKATYTGGQWGNIQNLGPNINTDAYETMPSISPGGSSLHFARGAIYSYVSYFTGSSWTVAQLLSATINDTSVKAGLCYKPGLQKLYFGSDRIGTYGSWDLWQCSTYNVQVEPVSLGQLRSLYYK